MKLQTLLSSQAEITAVRVSASKIKTNCMTIKFEALSIYLNTYLMKYMLGYTLFIPM